MRYFSLFFIALLLCFSPFGERYEVKHAYATFFGNTGAVSTNNTTSTPLSGAATYTGTGERNLFSDVFVYAIADQAGTMYFQWSNGNVTYYDFPTAGIPVSANIPRPYSAKKAGRYFRVRYVNGSSAQSAFSLTTYYGENLAPLVSALNQRVNLDDASTLVRPTFPWMDVSRGLLNGVIIVKKFGRNAAVGTTYVPVTQSGVYRTPQSGSATTLRIKAGGNANDTAAGTGAREVTVSCLDQNFNIATEAIATAGASASSATTITCTRLWRVEVTKSGTYASVAAATGSQAGAITIENGSGGTDWSTITATGIPSAQSEIGWHSIPDGYTGYVFRSNATVDTTKSTDLKFMARCGADETSAPYSPMQVKSTVTGIKQPISLTGNQLPQGGFVGPCDVGWMAKVDTGTAAVAVEFEVFMINE